jgi:purine-nucleoside phosphorylase
MVKILGADCVGMSTVPEVVASHGFRTLESVITDIGDEILIPSLIDSRSSAKCRA